MSDNPTTTSNRSALSRHPLKTPSADLGWKIADKFQSCQDRCGSAPCSALARESISSITEMQFAINATGTGIFCRDHQVSAVLGNSNSNNPTPFFAYLDELGNRCFYYDPQASTPAAMRPSCGTIPSFFSHRPLCCCGDIDDCPTS